MLHLTRAKEALLRRVVIGASIGAIEAVLIVPREYSQALIILIPICAIVGGAAVVVINAFAGYGIRSHRGEQRSYIWECLAVENWFAASVLSVFALFMVTEVVSAIETARRATCHNRLIQHSGHHPSDVVQLDRELTIIRVSSCPLCSGPDSELVFLVEGEERRWWTRSEAQLLLPTETYLRAIGMLGELKKGQRYWNR